MGAVLGDSIPSERRILAPALLRKRSRRSRRSFIDPGRFRGTCYRAANWKLLGLTTGRGKDSTSKRPNRSIKEVLGYALTPRFRELLSQS